MSTDKKTPHRHHREHHPAILLVLERLPVAEALMLRAYMNALLEALQKMTERGHAVAKERDALLSLVRTMLEAMTEDVQTKVASVAALREAAGNAGPPDSPQAHCDAQRQTQALLAALRQRLQADTKADDLPKGEPS